MCRVEVLIHSSLYTGLREGKSNSENPNRAPIPLGSSIWACPWGDWSIGNDAQVHGQGISVKTSAR